MKFLLTRQTRIALLLSGLLAPTLAFAQGYPTKTIRMVVPFAAGGNTDIIARIISPEMGKQFGQQIVIDNRGGGGCSHHGRRGAQGIRGVERLWLDRAREYPARHR